MILPLVAGAGALGAVSRYLVEQGVAARIGHRRFPWGTWAVNVTGSLVLGFVTGLALYHGLDGDTRAVVGAGFLGGYTTFSTLAFQAVETPPDAPLGRRRAAVYVGTSIAAGLVAATAGLLLAAA